MLEAAKKSFLYIDFNMQNRQRKEITMIHFDVPVDVTVDDADLTPVQTPTGTGGSDESDEGAGGG